MRILGKHLVNELSNCFHSALLGALFYAKLAPVWEIGCPVALVGFCSLPKLLGVFQRDH